jgi:hypothetical protein
MGLILGVNGVGIDVCIFGRKMRVVHRCLLSVVIVVGNMCFAHRLYAYYPQLINSLRGSSV